MAKKRIEDNLKQSILEKTKELLLEDSFSDITLKEISKEVGISQGTLYYYYKSKEDILYDIFAIYLDSLFNETIEWISDKNKDTSLHRISKFVILKGTEFSSLRLNLIVAANTHPILKERLIDKYNQFNKAFYDNLRKIMSENDAKFISWLFIIISDGVNIQKYLENNNFDELEFTKLSEEFFKEFEKGESK